MLGPAEAVSAIRRHDARVGVIFGGEAKGLPNDVVAMADAIISYPVSPRHASMNLAQAICVFAYAWRSASGDAPAGRHLDHDAVSEPPAERAVLEHFISYLEDELEAGGFFYPPEKTPQMRQNIRTALVRAQMTDQEVRTFYGMVKALVKGRGPAWAHNREEED